MRPSPLLSIVPQSKIYFIPWQRRLVCELEMCLLCSCFIVYTCVYLSFVSRLFFAFFTIFVVVFFLYLSSDLDPPIAIYLFVFYTFLTIGLFLVTFKNCKQFLNFEAQGCLNGRVLCAHFSINRHWQNVQFATRRNKSNHHTALLSFFRRGMTFAA